jgi:hypothetical protein
MIFQNGYFLYNGEGCLASRDCQREEYVMTFVQLGALAFGLVIGWVTYRTLRRTGETVALSNIATVIGAVGGAAVTSLFDSEDLFAAYCIGLAIGFFLYLIMGATLFKNVDWLGSGD